MGNPGVILWYLLWGTGLARIGIQDLKTYTISNRGCLGILLLSAAWHRGDPARMAENALVSVWVLLLGYGVVRLSGRRGLGGGDVKLTAAAALRLGGGGILGALLLALLPALGVSLAFRRRGRKKIPLGPFLAAGFFISSFCAI